MRPCRPHGGHFIRLPRSGDLWWMGIDLVTDGLDSADLAAAERDRARPRLAFPRSPARATCRASSAATIVATRAAGRHPRQPPAAGAVPADRGRPAAPDGCATTASPAASWPAEVHTGDGGPQFTPVGGDGYYHVPLAALRPVGVDNLWLGGRTIGCDEAVYGSLRVMGTAFATGACRRRGCGVRRCVEARARRERHPRRARAPGRAALTRSASRSNAVSGDAGEQPLDTRVVAPRDDVLGGEGAPALAVAESVEEARGVGDAPAADSVTPRANSGSGRQPAPGPIIASWRALRQAASTASSVSLSSTVLVLTTLLQSASVAGSSVTR